MKKGLLLFLGFVISSCGADYKDLNIGLNSVRGRNVNALIAKIGYPDSTLDVAGRKLYVWEYSDTYTYTDPKWTTTDKETQFSYEEKTDFEKCTLKVAVDDKERIIDYQHFGDAHDCSYFGDKFSQ